MHAWLQESLRLRKELPQCEVGSTPGGRSIQEWVMPPELVDRTGIILGPDMQSHLEEWWGLSTGEAGGLQIAGAREERKWSRACSLSVLELRVLSCARASYWV